MEKTTADKAIFLVEGRRLTLSELMRELSLRAGGRKAVMEAHHG